MAHKFQDGTCKTVRATKDSIRKALLGDTSYVETVERWGQDAYCSINCDEAADDISLSLKGDHVISFTLDEMNQAIDNFFKLCDW